MYEGHACIQLLQQVSTLYVKCMYACTCRELKRLSSVTLSPVYAHFSETLSGVWTIRALRATDRFILSNQTKLDVNQRANYGSKLSIIPMYMSITIPSSEGWASGVLLLCMCVVCLVWVGEVGLLSFLSRFF